MKIQDLIRLLLISFLLLSQGVLRGLALERPPSKSPPENKLKDPFDVDFDPHLEVTLEAELRSGRETNFDLLVLSAFSVINVEKKGEAREVQDILDEDGLFPLQRAYIENSLKDFSDLIFRRAVRGLFVKENGNGLALWHVICLEARLEYAEIIIQSGLFSVELSRDKNWMQLIIQQSDASREARQKLFLYLIRELGVFPQFLSPHLMVEAALQDLDQILLASFKALKNLGSDSAVTPLQIHSMMFLSYCLAMVEDRPNTYRTLKQFHKSSMLHVVMPDSSPHEFAQYLIAQDQKNFEGLFQPIHWAFYLGDRDLFEFYKKRLSRPSPLSEIVKNLAIYKNYDPELFPIYLALRQEKFDFLDQVVIDSPELFQRLEDKKLLHRLKEEGRGKAIKWLKERVALNTRDPRGFFPIQNPKHEPFMLSKFKDYIDKGARRGIFRDPSSPLVYQQGMWGKICSEGRTDFARVMLESGKFDTQLHEDKTWMGAVIKGDRWAAQDRQELFIYLAETLKIESLLSQELKDLFFDALEQDLDKIVLFYLKQLDQKAPSLAMESVVLFYYMRAMTEDFSETYLALKNWLTNDPLVKKIALPDVAPEKIEEFLKESRYVAQNFYGLFRPGDWAYYLGSRDLLENYPALDPLIIPPLPAAFSRAKIYNDYDSQTFPVYLALRQGNFKFLEAHPNFSEIKVISASLLPRLRAEGIVKAIIWVGMNPPTLKEAQPESLSRIGIRDVLGLNLLIMMGTLFWTLKKWRHIQPILRQQEVVVEAAAQLAAKLPARKDRSKRLTHQENVVENRPQIAALPPVLAPLLVMEKKETLEEDPESLIFLEARSKKLELGKVGGADLDEKKRWNTLWKERERLVKPVEKNPEWPAKIKAQEARLRKLMREALDRVELKRGMLRAQELEPAAGANPLQENLDLGETLPLINSIGVSVSTKKAPSLSSQSKAAPKNSGPLPQKIPAKPLQISAVSAPFHAQLIEAPVHHADRLTISSLDLRGVYSLALPRPQSLISEGFDMTREGGLTSIAEASISQPEGFLGVLEFYQKMGEVAPLMIRIMAGGENKKFRNLRNIYAHLPVLPEFLGRANISWLLEDYSLSAQTEIVKKIRDEYLLISGKDKNLILLRVLFDRRICWLNDVFNQGAKFDICITQLLIAEIAELGKSLGLERNKAISAAMSCRNSYWHLDASLQVLPSISCASFAGAGAGAFAGGNEIFVGAKGADLEASFFLDTAKALIVEYLGKASENLTHAMLQSFEL